MKQQPKRKKTVKSKQVVIETRSLTKYYRGKKQEFRALNNVTFTVCKGEFIALMGRSGSGKSTLMNIIGCLDRPSSGDVFIEGDNVSFLNDIRLAEIRGQRIGFIFQTFNLIPTMTALKNVMLPMVITGTAKREREQRARELLRLMDLDNWSTHKPSELSGGQQQRVAIARALVNNPSIILADEPTGNLDTKTGEKVMQFLSSINKEGKTIILVTHDPVLMKYCSRTIYLRDGELSTRP